MIEHKLSMCQVLDPWGICISLKGKDDNRTAEPEAGAAKAFYRMIEARTAYRNQEGLLDRAMDVLLLAMLPGLHMLAAERRALTENPPMPAYK